MSDLGSNGLFDGLDDPAPPSFGNDLLPGVMQRGQHIRRQRRIAYGVGSACAALMVAGGTVGIVGVSGNNTPQQPTLHGSTTPPHPKNPHHHGHSPGATVGGRQRGGNGSTQTTPPACVTPTPSNTESPSATPTPTDSAPVSPVTTASPVAYTDSTSSPAPTDRGCASPGATATPTPTDSASPTISPVPPLL